MAEIALPIIDSATNTKICSMLLHKRVEPGRGKVWRKQERTRQEISIAFKYSLIRQANPSLVRTNRAASLDLHLQNDIKSNEYDQIWRIA